MMAQKQSGNQPKHAKKKPAHKPAGAKKNAGSNKAENDTAAQEKLRRNLMLSAMTVVGNDGWESASIAAVARDAGVKPAEAEALYKDIWDILADLLDDIEDRTEAEVRDYMGDSWHDNLLEILMVRFDFAQDYRPALSSLPVFALRHPRHSRRFMRRMYDTMERMLYLARVPDEKISPLSISGFCLIYLSLVDRWNKDTTQDLSPTMAAIDKRLAWFEQASGYIERIPCAPLAAPVRKAAGKAKEKAKAKAKKLKSKIKAAA